jgi:hypothetical protein
MNASCRIGLNMPGSLETGREDDDVEIVRARSASG